MDDPDKLLENLTQELNRGTLVLSVLLSTEARIYGYALVTRLKEQGMEVEQNTLYPLLRRLEKQGLLESAWDTTDARPRRYYAVSEGGRQIRTKLLSSWKKMNSSIIALEETL